MSHNDDNDEDIAVVAAVTTTTTTTAAGAFCPICYEDFQQEESESPKEEDDDSSREEEEERVAPHVAARVDAHAEAPRVVGGDEEEVAAAQPPTASRDIVPAPNDDCRTVLPVTLAGCAHTFCNACLLAHVGHSVEAKALPLACPGCRKEITEEQVVRLLDQCEQGLADRFHRQLSLVVNPELLPCSQCDGLVDPSGGPDLTCPVCRHSFCQVHGDTHPGLTCAAFAETDQGRQLLQSEQVLNRFTKPCSRCGARLQKAAGCDYVVCGHCRKPMCYRCGTHEFMTGEDGRGFRKCQQCQTTYQVGDCHMSPVAQCLLTLVMTVLSLVLIAAWPVAAAGVILLTCCCGGCFHCGRSLDRQRPAQTRPVQAVLAMIVLLFLPLFMLAEGIYQNVSGNEGGFIGSLIPAFDDKTNELPVMEVQASEEGGNAEIETTIDTAVDVERGHAGEAATAPLP
jgi:hypothetical protein